MAKNINFDQYKNLLKFNCDKSKHRFRINKYGVTWCVICGKAMTSSGGKILELDENDKLIISNNI